MVVRRDEEVRANLLDVLWREATICNEVILDAAVLVAKQLEKSEHRIVSESGAGHRQVEGTKQRMRKIVSYRQVNMFSAASVLDAKSGTCARRAMTICRAGSRPTRVKA